MQRVECVCLPVSLPSSWTKKNISPCNPAVLLQTSQANADEIPPRRTLLLVKQGNSKPTFTTSLSLVDMGNSYCISIVIKHGSRSLPVWNPRNTITGFSSLFGLSHSAELLFVILWNLLLLLLLGAAVIELWALLPRLPCCLQCRDGLYFVLYKQEDGSI